MSNGADKLYFIEYDGIGLMFQAHDLYALVTFKRMLSMWLIFCFKAHAQRAPKIMIYLAPSVLVLMRADPLRGQVGRGWALEIETLFVPVKST